MRLLSHSSKSVVSSKNQETRHFTEFLNCISMQSLLQLRQDRSVHVGEILLVPSPDEGGGHQGDKTLKMDYYKKKKNAKKKKIEKKKRKTKIRY